MTLISGLRAGPAVSLNGSPTVSPMTVALWLSRPLAAVLALLDQLLRVVPRAAGVGEHDRQELAGEDGAGQERAERLGLQEEPDDDRGRARPAGRASSARAARSSCRCRPPARSPASRSQVHDPRDARGTACGPRSRPGRPRGPPLGWPGRRTGRPPSRRSAGPTSTSGWSTRTPRKRKPARRSATSKEPNSEVAAMTAVAMAMPLVMALVEFPTASRPVRISAGRPSNSPDISAMPWALSEIGPKVSIDTMTPTVVSMPMPVEGDEVQRARPGVARPGRTRR